MFVCYRADGSLGGKRGASITLLQQPPRPKHGGDARYGHPQRAGHEARRRDGEATEPGDDGFLFPAINTIAARDGTPKTRSPERTLVNVAERGDQTVRLCGLLHSRPICTCAPAQGNHWLLQIAVVGCAREQFLPAQYQAPGTHRARRDWRALPHRRHHPRGFCAVAGINFRRGRIVCHLRGVERLVRRAGVRHQDEDLSGAVRIVNGETCRFNFTSSFTGSLSACKSQSNKPAAANISSHRLIQAVINLRRLTSAATKVLSPQKFSAGGTIFRDDYFTAACGECAGAPPR